MLIAFHKPYGVLSQFSSEPASRWRTLAHFAFPKGLYPLGRLDADSEGLLLLSDEASLNSRLLDPAREHGRVYWAQVEGVPKAESLLKLERGVPVQGRRTLPCEARLLDPPPDVPARVPPIRFRKHVADSWIQLLLTEGRNRQVRRMTAAVGHPTLRLIRVQIGAFMLDLLSPGTWRILSDEERQRVLARGPSATGVPPARPLSTSNSRSSP